MNVSRETKIAREIGSHKGELNKVESSLEDVKTQLEKGWDAKEVKYINEAVDQLKLKVSNAATKLSTIQSDIIKAAEEIKREEEEAEAARRKAEEERKAAFEAAMAAAAEK